MAKKKEVLDPEFEAKKAQEKQEVLLQALSEAYMMKLDEEMGKLHDQFVIFIETYKLPLPQALAVIEVVRKEIIDQICKKYLGD